MSEKNPEFSREQMSGPNLIENFDRCLDVVCEIESKFGREVDLKGRDILKHQLGDALAYLLEQKDSVKPEDLTKFEKRAVSGFQGLGGFNRYIVRGNGAIGLSQSHSVEACIKKAEELGVETPEYNF